MKQQTIKSTIFFRILLFFCMGTNTLFAQQGRTTISLNGQWEFDQTTDAFPPQKFTRTIPVPGLISLAEPHITQYNKLFKHAPSGVPKTTSDNYVPMYSWYKKKIKIDANLKGQVLFLTLKKSQYVTQVFVNGKWLGSSMECYTPIDFNITDAIKFGQENEILIQVGERAWLPKEAPGSTDQEKIRYIPGIWDDVYIAATGKVRVNKALFLPSLAKKEVSVNLLLESVHPAQIHYGDAMTDPYTMEIEVHEKVSGKLVAQDTLSGNTVRENITQVETSINIPTPQAWTPDTPFLYTGIVKIYDQKHHLTDSYSVNFGMRDFSTQGKHFTLNGSQFYLRGSNITLQRFFEDPDSRNLVWNKAWVKQLMIDYPKSIDWNAMRICVGVVPDFWYDLCDEYGIVLQNEWFNWQSHGWNDETRKEFTNWVWSDGNHPSIVIWDALNENWNTYIGKELIPELKKLDPTRIWDTGYMTQYELGKQDDMDEPHPYQALTMIGETPDGYLDKHPYNLGALNNWGVPNKSVIDAGVPQLVNEYGWIWLWRDGSPAKLTGYNYNYYLGANTTVYQRRELQAYWLQLETEWIRSQRSIAGTLAFCYLTNNYGFTGDWFINDVKDLEGSPVLHWFKHCFAPEAVFIDLTDERYTKHLAPHQAGSSFSFNLVGINDLNKISSGKVELKLLNDQGKTVLTQQDSISIAPFGKQYLPCNINLPIETGGYLLVASYYPEEKTAAILSRRYIEVGTPQTIYHFYDLKP